MAVDKPTVRAQEALAAASSAAEERGHQAIEPEHLLLALLDAREGVVAPVLERAGADLATLRAGTVDALARRPVVRGATQQTISPAFRDVVRRAGEDAEGMKDEYLSTEHLLLASRRRSPAPGGAARRAGVTASGCWTRCSRCAGSAPRHRPEPRGEVPGAGEVRPRSDRAGRAAASSTR